MRIFTKSIIFGLFIAIFLSFGVQAFAYNPILTVNSSGADAVINISGGQPNASVVLSYTPSGSSLATTITGMTDYSGNFSTTVSSAYGLNISSQIYATVAGQQVTLSYNGYNGGCTYNCGNPYGLSLSQSNLNLYVGQSMAVSANNYGGAIYIASNSNSYVATATVSGNQIMVYANQVGSTTISVCANNNGVCASLYVTVSGNGGGSGNVWFSPANPSLYVGQSLAVSVNSASYATGSYASGPYYVSSNSNPSVVSANISGTVLNLYASQSGSSTISVCLSSLSFCGNLYVVVNGGSGTGLSLSQTSLNLTVGQSGSVTAYNTSGGSLYISGNSNSNVVTANVSGQVINFVGINNGSSTVSICANNSSQCGSVYVTVSGSGYSNNNVSMTDNVYSPKVINVSLGVTVVWTNNGSMVHTVTADDNSFTSGNILPGASYTRTFNSQGSYAYHCNFHGGTGGSGMSGVVIVGNTGQGLTLAQNSVNMAVSQSTSVAISGAGGYFISTNSNPGVVNATISGSSVYLNSLSAGSSTVTVCQNLGSSQCATLFVTVTSGSGGSAVWFSQNTVSLNSGQNSALTIYSNNYNGNFYINSNSSPGVVLANISGNTLNLTGQATGTSTVVVCQGSGSINCGSVYVTVNGGSCTYNCGNNNLSLSQTNLSLGANQSASVNIYGNGNYYVSSNSNSAVASATLSGSVLNVYAGLGGNTTITVCQNGTSTCATLYVTVNASLYGSLLFNTGTLPIMAIGQYYSYQLQASGGTLPYNYSLISGTLPYGLSLSPSGLISGIPSAGQNTANFAVRASDNYGHNATANFTVSGSLVGGGVLGASSFANGALIAEGPTVYIVYKNSKSAFTNASVFLDLGFKFYNVLQVGSSSLGNSGYVISTSRAQHPWGSWIKSGQTIYFVHDQGLIPVPNMNIFASSGGVENLIVPANSYDFRLPILSTMIYADPRLQ